MNPYAAQGPAWRAYTRNSSGDLEPLAVAAIINGEVRLERTVERHPIGHPSRVMQGMIEEEAMFQLAEAKGVEPARSEGLGLVGHPIVWEPPL